MRCAIAFQEIDYAYLPASNFRIPPKTLAGSVHLTNLPRQFSMLFYGLVEDNG